MDIKEIDLIISDLESSDISMQEIRDLAALYVVRDNLKDSDSVSSELNDILPAYKKYVRIKRDYQLGFLDDTLVKNAIQDVCNEIYEFVSALYNNTDFSIERLRIKGMITTLQRLGENYNGQQ